MTYEGWYVIKPNQPTNQLNLFEEPSFDVADAYLQVGVYDYSKKVVMNTHRGLFRFSRHPFGIKSAPAEIFSMLI